MATPKIQGAKYRATQDCGYVNKGDEVTLVYDDGSYIPWFGGPIVTTSGSWFTPSGRAKKGDPGAVRCEPEGMDCLELIEVPDHTSELEALRKENAALKAQLAAKEPLKVGDRVRVELPSMEGTVAYGDVTDGTYRVNLDGLGEEEDIWLKPERLTRIG